MVSSSVYANRCLLPGSIGTNAICQGELDISGEVCHVIFKGFVLPFLVGWNAIERQIVFAFTTIQCIKYF